MEIRAPQDEGDAEKTVKKAQVTKTKTPVALGLTTTEEQLGVQKLLIPNA